MNNSTQLHIVCVLVLTATVLATFFPATVEAQIDLNQRSRNGEIKGFTEPYRSIELAAMEMGTVSSIEVREGDRVQSGTLLGRLDESVLLASQAMIREAIESEGRLNAAEAELELHREMLVKLEGLLERKHASVTEIERARSQVAISEAQLQSIRDEQRVKQRELERVDAQLEQRHLRSPIDGVVTRVYKDVGEFVSANDPVVFSVVQLDRLLVVLSVPQPRSIGLSPGVKCTLSMGSERLPVSAEVEFVSPVADAQSGTHRVKLVINNEDQRWKSGEACYLNPANINVVSRASKTPLLLATTPSFPEQPGVSTSPHSPAR